MIIVIINSNGNYKKNHGTNALILAVEHSLRFIGLAALNSVHTYTYYIPKSNDKSLSINNNCKINNSPRRRCRFTTDSQVDFAVGF